MTRHNTGPEHDNCDHGYGICYAALKGGRR